VNAAATPAVASTQAAAPVAPKQADTPAPAKPAKYAAALPAKAPVTVEAIEAPAEAMAAQAWLKPMPAGTYVVQHAAMPTYDAALQWQKSQAALSAARIVAVYRPKQKMAYFIVVSGPFATRELAFDFTRSRGIPADTWVRTASSLREQFTPEQTTAAKR
jgi:septal ring-binding cell division protein DamX